MIATATLVVGVVRAVMRWPSYDLSALDAHGVPVVCGFTPIPHSSRKGWVAKHSCFPQNPFTSDVDARLWPTSAGETLSLRELARRTVRHFRGAIERLGDARSLRVIDAVLG